jgi:rhodanese-related sulfurtransferase
MTVKSISMQDFLRQRNLGSMVVVDVRSAEEYAAGHVEGAVHVPGEHILRAVETFRAGGLHIVAVCTKGGGRSQAAATTLVEVGLDATFLEGGTLAWQAATTFS